MKDADVLARLKAIEFDPIVKNEAETASIQERARYWPKMAQAGLSVDRGSEGDRGSKHSATPANEVIIAGGV